MEIGAVIVVCFLGLVPLTRASMNPGLSNNPSLVLTVVAWTSYHYHSSSIFTAAYSFGAAALSDNWRDQWIFWLAPALGSGLAAFVYKTFFTSVMIELNPVLGV